jgi:hypothetical protein
VLVRLGDVTVTTRVVESLRWGRLPVSRVVSIRPSRSIVLGAAVDVRDADGESRRYKFSTADAARKFILALRRANPSVPLEEDEQGAACVVWTR